MEYRKPEMLLVLPAAEAIQSNLAKGMPRPDSDGGPIESTGSAYQADE
jgi:hypothetical protein